MTNVGCHKAGPHSQRFTYAASFQNHVSLKTFPIHSPLSLSQPPLPPSTPLLDCFCFHRNWVSSLAFFSHWQLPLPAGSASARSITAHKRPRPRLPASKWEFAFPSNASALCTNIMYAGLLLTGGVPCMGINRKELAYNC